MKMDEELVIKYIRTKNKVRKIVTYKENSELRIYHQKVGVSQSLCKPSN